MIQTLKSVGGSHRLFHSGRRLFKNPYYYYDLGLKQPKNDGVESDGSKLVFNPSVYSSTEDMSTRAKRVFGDLGSRDKSRSEAESKAVVVCGVKVPARPEEPTNCCMSGCVNCVWELYKDEIEEWRDRVKEARHKIMELPDWREVWPDQLGPLPGAAKHSRPVDTSGSDDGVPIPGDDEEFDGLNTGIRVFIETEKRLRTKRAAKQARA